MVGAPGVGKSALARKSATAAVADGRFKHALFVDMNGYDPTLDAHVMPEQVYAPVLSALGIQNGDLPGDLAMQAAMYRDYLNELAESDDRVLLVVDNVSDPTQVEPLLPEGRTHRTIITSRDTFALSSARRLEVDVLDPHSAVQLISAGLTIQNPRDQRIVENSDDAAELARLCGHLPLALEIVAALLGDEPERALASLVDELDAEATRLSDLEFGTNLSVRAAFELSYRRLSKDLAELFRLLPTVPGEDAAVETVAALIHSNVVTARQRLMRLTRAHLIERPVNERWRMHDLIRLYASELSEADPQATETAFRRVFVRIAMDVASAGSVLLHEPPPPSPRVFGSEAEAAAWFDDERRTIVGLVERLAENPKYRAHVPDIAHPICAIFERLRFVTDRVAVASAWKRAVEATGDRAAEAIAHNILGSALRTGRRFDEALAMTERSLAIYKELGDEKGRGVTLNNRANILQDLGRFNEAIELYRQDVAICEEFTDVLGQADAMNNIAAAMIKIGEFEEASAAIRRAGDLYEEIGDDSGKARVLNNFGSALQGAGKVAEAVGLHRKSAELYRQNGDRHAQAGALNNTATALTRLSQCDEALQVYEGVLEIAVAMNDDGLQATTLDNIGLALLGLGRHDEAIESHRRSIDRSNAVGDEKSEACANYRLGDALRESGRIPEARVAARRSLSLFENINAPEAEQSRRLLDMLSDE
ncbi:hypothetical protein B2J88_51320 [Rhodococcus sp. SRB_17]|nr:hypothetical protein [Rhodococcus sp. SRB_17]